MAVGTVTLNASSVGGVILGPSGPVQVPSNGRITVALADAAAFLALGCTYIFQLSKYQSFSVAPVAASAGHIVSSTSLANGTLSIANQPDVPRVCAVRIDPGTTAITAGSVAMAYVANDGTTTTDSVSLATAASTVFTTSTSKGVVLMNSVIVTALAGGTSPKIQVNDTNSLALQVDAGYANFQVVRAQADGANETIGALNTNAASITPNTTPNGTHTFSFFYNYTAANVA